MFFTRMAAVIFGLWGLAVLADPGFPVECRVVLDEETSAAVYTAFNIFAPIVIDSDPDEGLLDEYKSTPYLFCRHSTHRDPETKEKHQRYRCVMRGRGNGTEGVIVEPAAGLIYNYLNVSETPVGDASRAGEVGAEKQVGKLLCRRTVLTDGKMHPTANPQTQCAFKR